LDLGLRRHCLFCSSGRERSFSTSEFKAALIPSPGQLLVLGLKRPLMPERLARYIEWQSGGRRTGRVANVGARNLPKTITGAEWQIDLHFNVAEEIFRDPKVKAVVKAAIADGVKVITLR
jgi:hypothetical protein